MSIDKENILVICRQNVGRSQMGEGFLKVLTTNNPNISVASAGLDVRGMREKYQNHPHPQVIAVMQEEGVDISQQSIKQIDLKMLQNATRIAVLVKKTELPDYFREFRQKTVIIPIEDPAPGSEQEVPNLELMQRYARDQIKQAMHQLVGYI